VLDVGSSRADPELVDGVVVVVAAGVAVPSIVFTPSLTIILAADAGVSCRVCCLWDRRRRPRIWIPGLLSRTAHMLAALGTPSSCSPSKVAAAPMVFASTTGGPAGSGASSDSAAGARASSRASAWPVAMTIPSRRSV
jgi:hypothetical protein